MSDLISRQAAVELIKNYCENGCDLAEDNWCPSCQREQFIKLLKELPPAQPERKTGRWIPHEDEDGEHYGDKCSECGEWYVMPYGKTNFCPNCGADMGGKA